MSDKGKGYSGEGRLEGAHLRRDSRAVGIPKHAENLQAAGLPPGDAVDYAALYVASLEHPLEADQIATRERIERDNPGVLTPNFGYFRGEHPAVSGPAKL